MRAHHVAVNAGEKYALVWGGDEGDGMQIDTSTVDTFDVLSASWQEPRQLRGTPLPDRFHKMAVAWDEKKTYLFGGKCDFDTRFNDVYEIDLKTLECKKLTLAEDSAPPPSPRSSCSMVCARRRLVIYGGFTGMEQSDELHVFDLDTSEADFSSNM